MFLPTTREELQYRGWECCDVILISGDSYIDCPQIGISLIGRVLENAGFRIGVITQPILDSDRDITRLGEPLLFWGVSGGSVDSMVANYTALKKKRRNDDFTPGALNDRRPDRAVIAYTNLIKRFYKSTKPIVLGGIEASLRRITHYDYWDDRLRAPILFDSKADFLLYGMADRSIVELANALLQKADPYQIRGLCYISKDIPRGYTNLPSFEECGSDNDAFIRMFKTFYDNTDPITASGLTQKKGDRWLIQNPPQNILEQSELDAVFNLPYERAQHPYYEKQGYVKALETIRFSITTHRGCYGECNFCAIAMHEGRTVHWRTEESILLEAESFTSHPKWKGIIQDIGGPTANMYAIECQRKTSKGACLNQRCIFPKICHLMKVDHSKQTALLKRLRKISGIRKVFVASGLRYDLALADKAHGNDYINELVTNHVSGQMKIAPEHIVNGILEKMGKPPNDTLVEFKTRFDAISQQIRKPQFLTYYFIAAYPGCSDYEMYKLAQFASQKLKLLPEQVQIFTPTPSTFASLMYYTETDPWSSERIFVEKNLHRKAHQKEILLPNSVKQKKPGNINFSG